MTLRYAIVGTGFSGTCMLWHLVAALERFSAAGRTLPSIAIWTIEQRLCNGPGLPYDPDEVAAYHLCNNPAEKMGLFDSDFVDWMRMRRGEILQRHSELILQLHPGIDLDTWQPAAAHFYPRALFGIYLSERFEEACARARALGIDVTNLNGTAAIDGASQNTTFWLALRNLHTGAQQRLDGMDKVLIASGHWTPAREQASHVVQSPYPAQRLRRTLLEAAHMARHAPMTVYVRGMGPSAVDAILSVCADGVFELDGDGLAIRFTPCWNILDSVVVKVVAGSRSGLFPGVRWPLVDHTFTHLTESGIEVLRAQADGRLALDDVLGLIDAECRDVGLAGITDLLTPPYTDAHEKLLVDVRGEWPQRLLHTIVLKARRLKFYQYLSAVDKRRYDLTLDTHFIRTAVPLPLQNARKLLCLIEADVLTTLALGYEQGPDAGFALTVNGACIHPDLVVCSNGQDYTMQAHPAPLLKKLLERGEIVAYAEDGYRTGGIAACEASRFRVQQESGTGVVISSCLYSFGPVTQYWQNQNNFAAAFVQAAHVAVQDWMAAFEESM